MWLQQHKRPRPHLLDLHCVFVDFSLPHAPKCISLLSEPIMSTHNFKKKRGKTEYKRWSGLVCFLFEMFIQTYIPILFVKINYDLCLLLKMTRCRHPKVLGCIDDEKIDFCFKWNWSKWRIFCSASLLCWVGQPKKTYCGSVLPEHFRFSRSKIYVGHWEQSWKLLLSTGPQHSQLSKKWPFLTLTGFH